MNKPLVHFVRESGQWWLSLCGKKAREYQIKPSWKWFTVNLATGVSNCPECCKRADKPLGDF